MLLLLLPALVLIANLLCFCDASIPPSARPVRRSLEKQAAPIRLMHSGLTLVATVDGTISAVKRSTGEKLWSQENLGGPLVKARHSSLDKAKALDHGTMYIPEPTGDGSLYFYEPSKGMRKMPFSIKDMVKEGFFTSEGRIYVGARLSVLYALDSLTGRIIDIFGAEEERPSTKELALATPNSKRTSINKGNRYENAILLSRTEWRLKVYEISGNSQKTSWTVSFSEFGGNVDFQSLNPSGHLKRGGSVIPPVEIQDDGTRINFAPDGGIVSMENAALDSKAVANTKNWSMKFPYPVVSLLDVMRENINGDNSPVLTVIKESLSADRVPLLEEAAASKKTGVLAYVDRLLHGRKLNSMIGPRPAKEVSSTKDFSVYVGSCDEGSFYALSASKFPIALDLDIPQVTTESCLFEATEHNSSEHITEEEKAVNYRKCLLGRHLIYPTSPAQLKDKLHDLRTTEQFHFSKNRFQPKTFVQKVFTLIAMISLIVFVFAFALRPSWFRRRLNFFQRRKEHSEPAANSTRRRRKRGLGGKANKSQSSLTQGTSEKPAKARHDGERSDSETMDNENAPEMVTAQNHTDCNVDGYVQLKRNSLIVYNEILGYGSHGTVVFRGRFEERDVAIKRVLLDFYEIAEHEVKLLQDSDDHPNVVRYYCKERCDHFIYIAIELCPATLHDIIENPTLYPFIHPHLNKQQILYDIALGIHHLHRLKLVHRDLKPRNILISEPKFYYRQDSAGARHDKHDKESMQQIQSPRTLISDLGLCKRLEPDQSSFSLSVFANGTGAPRSLPGNGTVGWRAPEHLVGCEGKPNPTRATQAVDIFSAGCLFYYVLTNGEHPYGGRYEREGNMVAGLYDLSLLQSVKELREAGNVEEARSLIQAMIDHDPQKRPNSYEVQKHPYFWSSARRLAFLQDCSDRFEIEPRPPHAPVRSPLLNKLEHNAHHVTNGDWKKEVDSELMEDLGRRRGYDGTSIRELLRAMRNKLHHFQDLPKIMQEKIGDIPEGYYRYFADRFPGLLMHVYLVVAEDEDMRQENIFRAYFM